jgi:hypothetical protein
VNVLRALALFGRVLAGLALASLPRRTWAGFDVDYPVVRMATVASVATAFFGMLLGAIGFLGYAERAGEGVVTAMLDTASAVNRGEAENVAVAGAWAVSMYSLPAFLFFTPSGWIALYLSATGMLRSLAAAAGEPFGDPLLTAADDVARASGLRRRQRRLALERERLEGPEVAEVLLSGRAAGAPEARYALVASRLKPGWTEGAFVLTSSARYRIGRPFDHRYPGGLRRVYPLIDAAEAEVMRRYVRCELPELSETYPVARQDDTTRSSS